MASGTTEDKTREVVERFRAIHGARYGYGEVRFYGTKVKVRILCPEPGHGVFEQTPENHLNGSGCPLCKGRNIWETRAANGPREGKSFADLRPKWVYQWDVERNGGLRPERAYPTSGKVVWWHEPECDHRWQQKISDRGVAAQQCPVCTGDIFQPGVNDLITLCPDLAREWHPVRNSPLTPGELSVSSGQRVWWKCTTCGNEWEAKVNARTKGNRTGCPACGTARIWEKRGKPALENSVAGRASSEVLAQWSPRNDVAPQDVYFGNTSLAVLWVYHGCHHEWQQSVYYRAKAAPGCPVCDGRVIVAGINDLGTTNPTVAARWHPTLNGEVAPRDLRPFSNKKFWWVCPICKQPYERTVTGMVSKGSVLCRDCARKAGGQKRSAPVPGHSFADEYPDLAREWHPTLNEALRPNQVRSGSNKPVWWMCSFGHTWSAKPSERTSPRTRRTCPHCTPGSNGERAIVDVLKEHEIMYERQWSDSPLRDQGVLRYDFMLPVTRTLIEFDGEQHRRPTRFGNQSEADAITAFDEQQRRDKMKTEWARDNGWTLIRISSIPTVEGILRAIGVI